MSWPRTGVLPLLLPLVVEKAIPKTENRCRTSTVADDEGQPIYTAYGHLCLVRLSAERLMTCYLPRRAPINRLRNRGERRPCPTAAKQRWARGEPVALTLTALAPQLFRDLVVRSFCVSRFTVNKKAQITRREPSKQASKLILLNTQVPKQA